MAQLFRISKSHDTTESQTFTFILPSATAQDYPPEILSRDFTYAGHKWRISLLKQDRHLSPFLQMSNVSEGLRCVIDFTFVLVHRRSFTDNEQYWEKQREFNLRQASHGRRTFVTLDDLSKRQFTDARGEYLFEVTLKNPKTVFEQIFTVNVPVADSKHGDTRDYQRYDTSPFNFGEQDWICVFCPNMDCTEKGNTRHMVQLNRRSRSDMLCKVRYRISIGEGGCIRSENREEIFDFNGTGEAFYFIDDYFLYIQQGNRLQLTVELYSVSFVNHMKLNVLCCEKRPVAQCFDRDRQTWCITTTPGKRRRSRPSICTQLDNNIDDSLSLTLLYPDVQNIPRNYLRYVSWSLHIIAPNKKHDTSQSNMLTAIGAPFEHYYSQLETDNGYIMKTRFTLDEIRENSSKWLDDVDKRLTVQLEWLGTYLLLHPAYHAYDDIYRRHVLQMRREVQALQSENNTLEKQVHDLQLKVANQGSTGSDTPPRPRTASGSSNLGGAGHNSTQPTGHTERHRNSATALEVVTNLVGIGDNGRPPRSTSGVDVASMVANDAARPITPRGRAGSGVDHSDGIGQYAKGHRNMRENDGADECSPDTPYASSTKRHSTRYDRDVAVLLPDPNRRRSSGHRPDPPRSPSRSSQRHRVYPDEEYDGEDRSDYLSAGRTIYVDTANAGSLVRSKSASPYPHRVNSANSNSTAYWRPETPDEDCRDRKYNRQSGTTITSSQLKPEPMRFGDEGTFSHQRNRSFRMNHHKERKMSNSRYAGREAEDAVQQAYYYP